LRNFRGTFGTDAALEIPRLIKKRIHDNSDRSESVAKECVMLVLTRKLQEKIRIGNDITITVLRVKGNTVRIGVEAPRDVRVVRGELARFEMAPLAARVEQRMTNRILPTTTPVESHLVEAVATG
jgi:carbon storage regulator CsrA